MTMIDTTYAPVRVEDVFVTGKSGETVVALEVAPRTDNVWSVRVVPVRLMHQMWVLTGDDERWTSVKYFPETDTANVEIVGRSTTAVLMWEDDSEDDE